MLAEGSLQSLLQHLSRLLLPVITQASDSATSSAQAPSGAATASDCRQVLGIEAEDLDMLLAVLEALASSGAGTPQQPSCQVSASCLQDCCCRKCV